MTPLGFLIIIISVAIGFYFGKKKFEKYSKNELKDINKIINDPILLAEKLKQNGPMFEQGKKVDIEIKKGEFGNDELVINLKENKKSSELESKIDTKENKKSKKKVKKKKIINGKKTNG